MTEGTEWGLGTGAGCGQRSVNGGASGGGKGPALASDSEGASRVPLRLWDVQEQGLVARGVRADRVPSAAHVCHWGRRVLPRLRTG